MLHQFRMFELGLLFIVCNNRLNYILQGVMLQNGIFFLNLELMLLIIPAHLQILTRAHQTLCSSYHISTNVYVFCAMKVK